ncbi:hypothetical protein ABW16_21620 [Mycolicibacter heraklionensis]|uniref:Holin n=1 Tax=Mycolicibacter heraklionensis TaxID=512402 RepID=A0ABR5FA22_9MYCO|nr:hypothetical protein [Mycolicibacter heraklionensis]KLO25910.1 hypothetical protein ABW16_21620 [Mycolicibacter heraklionensis]
MSEGAPVIDRVQQFINALPAALRQGAAAILAAAGGYQLVAFIDQYGPVAAASIYVQVGGVAAALLGALIGWRAVK